MLSKIQKVSKSQELQAKPKKIKKKTQNETPKQLSEDLSKVVEPFSPKVADSRVEKTKPSKPSAKPSKPLAKPSKTVEPFFPSVVDSTSKDTKPSIASNVKLEAVQDTFDQLGAEIDLSNSVSPKFKVFPAVPDEEF